MASAAPPKRRGGDDDEDDDEYLMSIDPSEDPDVAFDDGHAVKRPRPDTVEDEEAEEGVAGDPNTALGAHPAGVARPRQVGSRTNAACAASGGPPRRQTRHTCVPTGGARP